MKAHRNFVTGEVVLTLSAREASNLSDDIWELDGHVEFARFFASRADDVPGQAPLLTQVSNAVQFAQAEVEHETWDGRVPVPSKKGEDRKRHLTWLEPTVEEKRFLDEALPHRQGAVEKPREKKRLRSLAEVLGEKMSGQELDRLPEAGDPREKKRQAGQWQTESGQAWSDAFEAEERRDLEQKHRAALLKERAEYDQAREDRQRQDALLRKEAENFDRHLTERKQRQEESENAHTSSCQSCSKRPGREEKHPCPYDEELRPEDVKQCNCCENCMGNCAAAV